MERREMLAAGVAGLAGLGVGSAFAQGKKEPQEGHAVAAGGPPLSADAAALLLIDHQVGLFSLVGDYGPDEFNEDFVKAVKQTGRKQLIMAGIVTDVCIAFPALSALKEGYQVFVVADACGTFSRQVADAALIRMAQAGAVITNWFAVACELQRDWRKNGEGLANLLANHLPAYKNLITTHTANPKK
jgi:hypothetical protein